MKLADLLERIGLSKRAPNAQPTALDEQVAALRLSLESVEKSGLDPDEREAFIAETVNQFRDVVLKGGDEEEDEDEEEGDEDETEDEEEGESSTHKRDDSQEGDDMTPEQIKKYDEAVAKIATLETENKNLKDSNTSLGERVAKMEAEETSRVRLAKAEKLVRGTSLKAEDVATLMEKVGEDDATLTSIISALSKAQSDAKLFEELGGIGHGVEHSDVITARAAEIRKNDPKLTVEQATMKAYQENPDAYAEARRAEDESLRRR